MANTISALKRHRQSEVRRKQGHSVKSALRSQMRKVLEAVKKEDAKASQKELFEAYRLLDRAAVKGILHRNNAARKKARLAARVNAVAPDAKRAKMAKKK